MADSSRRKPVKIGVIVGRGRPPRYKWGVAILDLAHTEALGLLTPVQYEHMREQVRQLAREGQPARSALIDVRSVEDFYEIRDKGGPLGKLNVRVFFGICKVRRTIVVLGVIAKQNDGKTPEGDKIRMRVRHRRYMAEFCR